MIWLFCLSLIFAQEPPSEGDFPEPVVEESAPEMGDAGDAGETGDEAQADQAPPVDDSAMAVDEQLANQGSLVKRLTEPFNYVRKGKRDPFLLPETKEAPLLPGSYFGPFLPLQEVKLQDVVIKGIIMDRVKPKAFIQIPDDSPGLKQKKSRIVKVTVGDYLGENFGIIQAIREGKIIIVQTLGEGQQKSTSTITLSIRK